MERYSRQIITLGLDLQERLQKTTVLIAGCGATGSRVAELLARMGVGKMLVIDPDIVELSNLHRTALFRESDVGFPKAQICASRIEELNHDVKVEPIIDLIEPENVLSIVNQVDFVFDGLDSIHSRLVLNDAVVLLGKVMVFGGIEGEYGTVALVKAGETPCISCFLEGEESAGACEIVGTTGPLVDIVASLEVQLFLNYMRGNSAEGLIYIDGRTLELRRVQLERNTECQACSLGLFVYLRGQVQDSSCRIVRTKEPQNMSPEMEKPGVKVFSTLNGQTICYEGGKCFNKLQIQ